MTESIVELTNERNQLRESNRILANQVASFARMFEENKRQLMAHGWDKCADQVAEHLKGVAPLYASSLKPENPFRKPIDTGLTNED